MPRPPVEPLVLLLQPEWVGNSGLWRVQGNGTREAVDAEEIGLSELLADALEDWTDEFDSLFEEDEPETSRFHNRAAYAAFVAEGERIATLIRRETGAEVSLVIPAQIKPEDA